MPAGPSRSKLHRHELILRRLAEREPAQEQRFVRHWVRVELEEDRERELVGPLYLRFRGSRTEIASFLGAEERQGLRQCLENGACQSRISEQESGGSWPWAGTRFAMHGKATRTTMNWSSTRWLSFPRTGAISHRLTPWRIRQGSVPPICSGCSPAGRASAPRPSCRR